MSNDNEKQIVPAKDREDSQEAVNSLSSNNDPEIIPDSSLEKKIFLYASIINLFLWLYVFIFFDGNGRYLVIPSLFITIIIIFLYIRNYKKKKSDKWVENSFQEYKATLKKKREEE